MIDRADARVHAPDEMTSRQRLLAAYRREPTDRLPFWAKVTNETWRRGQPEKVRNLSDLELLDYILADGIFHAPRCAEVRLPRVERTESIDGNIRTVVSRTPDGDLIERWTRDETTGSWHPTEFPVKTREDLKRYRWLHECDVRPRDGEAAECK